MSLKTNDQYPIKHALNLCQRQNIKSVLPYLYERIGEPKQALMVQLSSYLDLYNEFYS